MSATELYWAARSALGLIDRSGRMRLEVTGPDRARFLHNLTTNEVKRLAPGQGCEAFVTSLQGKTLGYVALLVRDDRIVVRSAPGALATLEPHLARYGALDDVSWTDISPQTFELHVAGPRLAELAEALDLAALPPADLSHMPAQVAGRPVHVVREAPAGLPGITLMGSADDLQAVCLALVCAGGPLGLVALDPATFEALRIEAGTPAFGTDVTPENLPQEIGRDARAISFVKGCYLGQETVARIDALGHVNRVLKGGQVQEADTPPPPRGTELTAGGKAVGKVTSSAHSPGWGRAVVLALVRVAHAQAGTVLEYDHEGARHALAVADLPMPPPARGP